MLIQDNLVLNRSEPSGLGGRQFLYRVNNFGVSAICHPNENITQIHWEVEVIKFKDGKTLDYEICRTTELAQNTLVFRNDKSLNEFLGKSFAYFKEINLLEGMLEK